jgi:hypothetical protein
VSWDRSGMGEAPNLQGTLRLKQRVGDSQMANSQPNTALFPSQTKDPSAPGGVPYFSGALSGLVSDPYRICIGLHVVPTSPLICFPSLPIEGTSVVTGSPADRPIPHCLMGPRDRWLTHSGDGGSHRAPS